MGMGSTVLSIVALLVLGLIVFGRPPDQSVAADRQARWLSRAAVALMALFAAFWLVFGLAEILSGDWGGAVHLAPALMLGVITYLAWRRPLESGIVLILLGVLAAVYSGLATMQGGRPFQPVSLLGGVPYLVFGGLFIAAALLARRKTHLPV